MCSAVLLLPLACRADLAQPFSTPKLWLAVFLALAAVGGGWIRPAAPDAVRRPAWPWMAWVAAVSLSALVAPYASFPAVVLALAPLPAACALSQGRLSAVRIAQALVAGSAVLSAIVCLQFGGADPLQWLGWHPESFASSRMRMYGTMGNPNFAAAWLCATLPLTAVLASRWRRAAWLLPALQAAAILATGSRAAALALAVSAAVYAYAQRRVKAWWLAALPLAAAALWFSPARSLQTTLEGRLYLARVVLGHWREVPLAGYGPGALQFPYARWQAEWLRTHPQDGQAAAFAGEVDHVHNDYLEFFVEYGPPGIVAFLGVSAWLLAPVRSARRSSLLAAACAGTAALAVIACVDFPFHRPAEWCLYWLLAGMAGAPPLQLPTSQGEYTCRVLSSR
ncbi:MAG TPA: O-antigen ligase family protein [Bryobacteraceae bacterium]|nr:O-antigen ligase family protein [Bryobacteraceae bacterium]